MQALEAFKSVPLGMARKGEILCELEGSVPVEKLVSGFALTEREVDCGTGDQPEVCGDTIEGTADV